MIQLQAKGTCAYAPPCATMWMCWRWCHCDCIQRRGHDAVRRCGSCSATRGTLLRHGRFNGGPESRELPLVLLRCGRMQVPGLAVHVSVVVCMLRALVRVLLCGGSGGSASCSRRLGACMGSRASSTARSSLIMGPQPLPRLKKFQGVQHQPKGGFGSFNAHLLYPLVN